MNIYKCKICDDDFYSKDNLDYHIKSKHIDLRFSCEECGKKFMSKHAMKQHIDRLHRGII